MLYAALGCLMVWLVLAVLGLAGDCGMAVQIAWIPFLIGVMLLVIPLIWGPVSPAP